MVNLVQWVPQDQQDQLGLQVLLVTLENPDILEIPAHLANQDHKAHREMLDSLEQLGPLDFRAYKEVQGQSEPLAILAL
jgi:hypothetical protein